jgi:hypothetical protein
MIRAFLLLITLNVVCMVSYFTYNRMDSRLNSSEEIIKREMIEANQEMEKKLQNKIHDGREPDELIKFRESWLLRLQDIKSLRLEKKSIEKSLLSIIIPLFLSFKFAVIEFFYVDEISTWNGFKIYTSHVGWVFLLMAIITISQAFRSQNSCINMVNPTRLNHIHTFDGSTGRGLDSTHTSEYQTLQTPLTESTTISKDP